MDNVFLHSAMVMFQTWLFAHYTEMERICIVPFFLSSYTFFQWHTALKFPIFWPWNTNYISFCCPLAKFVLRLKYSLDIKWTKCWKRYWKFSCMEQYSCFWNTDPHLSSRKSFKYLNHTMLLKKLFILRDQNFL